ncbi:Type-1A pilin [Serratia quinivorans]|uniref:fimbrial protein n=1 Tax=Serratia quinivorans TaxID=137545 RepID=UPI00217B43F5|nr:fimbrial protein [Serratia quinivorans]CAI1145010.1 Type-1A pilin [Serratia quinivorans]
MSFLKYGMHKVISLLAYFLLMITCSATSALASNCYYNSGFSDKIISMSLGDIIAQRDTATGSAIYEKKITFYPDSVALFKCSDAARTWNFSSKDNTIATPGYPVGYYDIGVPGYSVAVYSGNSKLAPTYRTPAYQKTGSGTAGSDVIALQDLTTMYLVIYKTAGNASSGPVKLGRYAEFSTDKSGGGWIYPITLNITGGTITTTACSLTSTSINVPLGDVAATQFTGITTTAGDKTFNLGLSCDKDANINVALAGSQNADTADTSVLALTNAGQSGTAKGVGVQLLYGSVPLKLNNNILLKTSVGGQETLPFSARYYQTKTAIGAGLANSSATLNITYQ